MDRYDSIDSADRRVVKVDMKFFTGGVICAQIFGVISIILIAVWLGNYRGGYSLSDPATQFNYHPLCMVIGMVFVYGNAILTYRIFRTQPKRYIKILHAGLLLLSLMFAVIGINAAFLSHNNHKPKAIPNMYSLHSWLGISAVALYCLQWLFGFVTFLQPGLSLETKRSVKPLHVFSGLLIFVLSIAASLTGLTEKALFLPGKIYSSRGVEANLINLAGLSIAAFAACVVGLIAKSSFARPPEETDLETRHLTLS